MKVDSALRVSDVPFSSPRSLEKTDATASIDASVPSRAAHGDAYREFISDESLPPAVQSILSRSLFEPVRNLLQRPSKMVRAQLVLAGWSLSGEREDRPIDADDGNSESSSSREIAACLRMSDALEAIHAGSLIVDDIQDGSRERRGAPSLHEIFGVPLALNAGNWLYFQPFEWIRALGLPDATELALYRLCHETMYKAHMGQAIDLGSKIHEAPREHVRSICLSSLEMKTGALMRMAILSGAILGGASPSRVSALSGFGSEFGVALQMFDDIGNFCLPSKDPKRFEDLRLKRPTWLWAIAAEQGEDAFSRFKLAVEALPDEAALMSWVREVGFVNQARLEAEDFLESTLNRLHRELEVPERFSTGLQLLHDLSERIRTSYG